MSTIRSIQHGAWVAATGDTSRLRQLRSEAENSSIVRQAWANTGQQMRQAMSTVEDSRSRR